MSCEIDEKTRVNDISHHLSYHMVVWIYEKTSDEITYLILSSTKYGI